MTEDIEEVARAGKLTDIPGIGEGTAEKIIEYINTGKMSKYEEVMKGVSEETITLMQIPGLGPKTVAMLNKELGIVGLGDLEKALQESKLKGLFGIGDKKIENIMKGIELFKTSQQRISIGMAFPVVKRIVEGLKHNSQIKEIQAAGSLRRMKETIGDIDILASGTAGADIVKSFVNMRGVTQILAAGDTKGSVRVEEGVQVDLRVVYEDELARHCSTLPVQRNTISISVRSQRRKG